MEMSEGSFGYHTWDAGTGIDGLEARDLQASSAQGPLQEVIRP